MSEEYKCEECGETFDSERGLHIHIGEVHPEKKEEILSEEASEQSEEEQEEEKKEKSEEESKTEKKGDESSEEGIFKETSKSAIAAFSIIGIVLIGLILLNSGIISGPGDSFTATDAGDRALKLMKKLPQLQQADLKLINSSKTGSGVYRINIEISARGQTQTIAQYETKDGELLFPSGQKLKGADSKKVTKEEAGRLGEEQMKNYFERILIQRPNVTLSSMNFINSSGKKSGVYELNMEVVTTEQKQERRQKMKTYMTTDGKYFFMEGRNITRTLQQLEKIEKMSQQQTQPQ